METVVATGAELNTRDLDRKAVIKGDRYGVACSLRRATVDRLSHYMDQDLLRLHVSMWMRWIVDKDRISTSGCTGPFPVAIVRRVVTRKDIHRAVLDDDRRLVLRRRDNPNDHRYCDDHNRRGDDFCCSPHQSSSSVAFRNSIRSGRCS